MHLIYRLLGSPMAIFLNLGIVLYLSQRFWKAIRHHREMMQQMKGFQSIVQNARISLNYVGEEVSKGMDGIKEDIKYELNMTDRMTKLSSQVTAMVRRFTDFEEDVIEFIRTDTNTESVRLETPQDITEEVRKVLRKVKENQDRDESNAIDSTSALYGMNRIVGRNPLSKFSAVGGVSPATLNTREKQDRPRTPRTPEVQLLQEAKPPGSPRSDKRRE